MGTEVLHPQDLLADRLRVSPATFYRRRNFPANGNLTNLIVNRRPSYNTAHKKTSPRPDKKRSNATAESGGTKKVTHGGASEARRKDDGGLVMGQVTLLRRGESLDSFASKISGRKSNPRSPNQKPVDDLAVLGTNRIGPDSPVMLPKQIRLSPPSFPDVYAGSAFSLSPSPRSLPLPSFFNKKEQIDDVEIKPSDNPATRDLRRLLRLE
ncbi:hypothetical protein PHJA_002005900 [Phtheirospermum japonicum]|uniref:Uncharacterized protein n=1 Tax=Phtheirospermum japonicum TaxID=374723 RepID=A0A830CG10_9LAMI|nr:hypothetical protein PHJA_002005900 [Phtheirospermum japonicum]